MAQKALPELLFFSALPLSASLLVLLVLRVLLVLPVLPVLLLVGGDGKYSQSSKIRSSLIIARCLRCHPVIKWRRRVGVMSW